MTHHPGTEPEQLPPQRTDVKEKWTRDVSQRQLMDFLQSLYQNRDSYATHDQIRHLQREIDRLHQRNDDLQAQIIRLNKENQLVTSSDRLSNGRRSTTSSQPNNQPRQKNISSTLSDLKDSDGSDGLKLPRNQRMTSVNMSEYLTQNPEVDSPHHSRFSSDAILPSESISVTLTVKHLKPLLFFP